MAPEAGNFAIELVYNWGKDDGYPGGERFGHFAFETEDIDAVLPVLELFGGPRHAAAVPAGGRRTAHRVRRRPGRQLDRADPALRAGAGQAWLELEPPGCVVVPCWPGPPCIAELSALLMAVSCADVMVPSLTSLSSADENSWLGSGIAPVDPP